MGTIVVEGGDLLTRSGAVFSRCKTYRYRLWRIWDAEQPSLNFIMLNPSTADEVQNDPTVERCERRARRMGFGGLVVTNLFGLRSRFTADLYTASSPVGPYNDAEILAAALGAGQVIAAWGIHGNLFRRHHEVMAMLRGKVELWHLGMTKEGFPGHPLYISYDVEPRRLTPRID